MRVRLLQIDSEGYEKSYFQRSTSTGSCHLDESGLPGQKFCKVKGGSQWHSLVLYLQPQASCILHECCCQTAWTMTQSRTGSA